METEKNMQLNKNNKNKVKKDLLKLKKKQLPVKFSI